MTASGEPNSVSSEVVALSLQQREPAQTKRIETLDRAPIVDRNFIKYLEHWGQSATDAASLASRRRGHSDLPARDVLELFESQMLTRHLDLMARILRARDQAFYTIGSAGHEGNAVLGRLTRPTDPAFLHYRSGAFMAERSRKVENVDPVYDTLLSLVASSDDPIAGGRHKVWGNAPLWVLPQTSTIASHLPKAVGTAIALGRARRLGQQVPVPVDSIVVCTFGDASVNHSTAAGAFNCAQWTRYQKLPVPILFVCEDNGLGISVTTPPGWIETTFAHRRDLIWFQADGCDLTDAYPVCKDAIECCRTQQSPVFLHLKTTRLLGHAGSDIETEYRSLEEIEESEKQDPLIQSARLILHRDLLSPADLRQRYEAVRERVAQAAEQVVRHPRLTSIEEVVAPLAPHQPKMVREEATRNDYQKERLHAFGGEERLPESVPPRHLAVQINRALFDLMAKYPEAVLFGEDVARKGGVYHVTPGLARSYGASRVFDSLLDEQSILGMAQGCAFMGLLPIPEIQYLAYFHNACDQIRGEACSMQFFSNGQFRNPMVVRIASLGYQKGFGGHFHNDNSIAALRDIPGLIIACPSRGDDAAAMLRTCAALAKVDGRVIAFLEPIALYMTKDLYAARDGKWQFPYPPPETAVPFGEGRAYDTDASDLLIITYGNGVYLSLRATEILRVVHGINTRILDLRWLNPLNSTEIAHHARECEHVLVVDEGRRTGGLSEAIITAIVEELDDSPSIRRVVGHDSYIPLGPAANLVLPSEESIISAAVTLVASGTRR